MNFNQALKARDGVAMARLLDHENAASAPTWFAPLAAAYTASLRDRGSEAAFHDLSQAAEALLELFKEPGNAYLAPVMAKYVSRLPKAANRRAHLLRKCKEFLDSLLRNIRLDSERQSLALLTLSQIFKIFFALDTPALGTGLVRAVSLPGFPALPEFPLRDQITYSFYAGRLAVLEDNLRVAAAHLDFVHRALPRADMKRQKRVLEFLVPVKMSLGLRPDFPLLKRYKLDQLAEAASAAAAGKGRALAGVLAKHRDYFASHGTYLLACRLHWIASRQLLKACVSALGGSNKVALDAVVPAFARFDDVDPADNGVERVKCILANLIFIGLVRGYISHEHAVLVLSSKEPFPKTSSCLSREE